MSTCLHYGQSKAEVAERQKLRDVLAAALSAQGIKPEGGG